MAVALEMAFPHEKYVLIRVQSCTDLYEKPINELAFGEDFGYNPFVRGCRKATGVATSAVAKVFGCPCG